MSIYTNIDSNKRQTIGLIMLFPAFLFLVLLSGMFLYVIFSHQNNNEIIDDGLVILYGTAAFFGIGMPENPYILSQLNVFFMASLGYMIVVFGVLIPISIAWFFWIAYVRDNGGNIVLSSAKARQIWHKDNPELYNLVENIAITAGLPCPKLYTIDDDSLNAFAVGNSPENSSIALTTGIIKKLERSELEAVIAHEMAHIGNRDNYLMTIVVVGIGVFAFLGEMCIRLSRGRRKNNDKAGAIIIVAGVSLMFFSYIVAPFIRYALSRRREYQADATAVLLTRYPEALASALRKISKDPRVEVLDERPSVGAMCIANPLKEKGFSNIMNKFAGLTATHPPIEDRIKALGF